MIVGIDLSNIRAGGGITHIKGLMEASEPARFGISKLIAWGGRNTLEAIAERPWLEKVQVPRLEKWLPSRARWQQAALPVLLAKTGCDMLFAPGGVVAKQCPIPSIVVSQNLLPFEAAEYGRFPVWTLERARLTLLRKLQSSSMRRARGVIFLSKYARDVVLALVSLPLDKTAIIPHGVEVRFFQQPRPARPIEVYSYDRPFRLLYVSTVFFYKHQWEVAKAVASLRARGLPVTIDFVGEGHAPAKKLLLRTIQRLDPQGRFLRYRGGIAFDGLPELYHSADMFVFASSCETIAMVLLEAMAAGLPIAASRRGPVPEVVKEAAVYFDPEQAMDIAKTLEALIHDASLRAKLASEGHAQAQAYSWKRAAEATLSFIAKTGSS